MSEQDLPDSSIKIDYEGSRFLLFREEEELWEFDSEKGATFDNLYSRICNVVSGHPRDRFPLSNYTLEITDEARPHLDEAEIKKIKGRMGLLDDETESESEYQSQKDVGEE